MTLQDAQNYQTVKIVRAPKEHLPALLVSKELMLGYILKYIYVCAYMSK